MFHDISIRPRFCETDAAGHINNTSVMPWLEDGRVSLRMASGIALLTVVVRLEVDYLNELFFGSDVTVKTGIGRFGTKSLTYVQEIWQNGKCCIKATATSVGFDPQERKSVVISVSDREKLSVYRIETR